MSLFHRNFVAFVATLSLAACAETHDESGQSQESIASPENKSVVSAKDESFTEEVSSELLAQQLSHSELAKLVSSIQPSIARDRSLRFSDARLLTPDAAPLLISRLLNADEKVETRQALIQALSKTKGKYAQAVIDLLASEDSAQIRVDLVDSLRLSTEANLALQGLKLASTDADANVRTRAAYTIGRRSDGIILTGTLLSLLQDSEATVQSQSARSLGNFKSAEAFDKLQPLLSHRDATLRLESLRAMARIDNERAAELPELHMMAEDSDSRVRNVTAKVRNKAYN